MDLLSRFLRRTPPPAAVLAEAIERLQTGILTNLSLRYGSQLDPSEALELANCVLSHAICTEPLGVADHDYQNAHSDLIRQKALELVEIAEVAEALSYLYAAITMHLVIQTKDPFSEEASRLGARASELSLYIPNTQDICGSGNAIECVRAIATFSDNYLQRALGR